MAKSKKKKGTEAPRARFTPMGAAPAAEPRTRRTKPAISQKQADRLSRAKEAAKKKAGQLQDTLKKQPGQAALGGMAGTLGATVQTVVSELFLSPKHRRYSRIGQVLEGIVIQIGGVAWDCVGAVGAGIAFTNQGAALLTKELLDGVRVAKAVQKGQPIPNLLQGAAVDGQTEITDSDLSDILQEVLGPEYAAGIMDDIGDEVPVFSEDVGAGPLLIPLASILKAKIAEILRRRGKVDAEAREEVAELAIDGAMACEGWPIVLKDGGIEVLEVAGPGRGVMRRGDRRDRVKGYIEEMQEVGRRGEKWKAWRERRKTAKRQAGPKNAKQAGRWARRDFRDEEKAQKNTPTNPKSPNALQQGGNGLEQQIKAAQEAASKDDELARLDSELKNLGL